MAVPLLALAGAYGSAVALQSADPAEATFRLAGMFLQFGGFAIVAVGLRSTQQQFQAPGVSHGLKKWAAEGRKLLQPPPKHQVVSGSLPLVVRIIDDNIHLQPLLAEQSVEQKLQTLAENLKATTQELVAHRRTVQTELNKLDMAVSIAQHERIKDVEKVRKALQEFSTGGLVLEWIGLVWLLLGTVFGAVPQELGRFAFSMVR